MASRTRILAAMLAVSFPSWALAHHSFAVHYDGSKVVSVSGVVREFHFRNPHGMIVVDEPKADGGATTWKIETNSPNILRRRGWSPDSIKVGDEVTIEGFPSRDGTPSMRVYRVKFSDGRQDLIGQRPAAGVER